MKKVCRMHEVGKGQCGRDGLDLVMGGRVEEMQLQISRSIPEGAAKKNMEFEASAGSWMSRIPTNQHSLPWQLSPAWWGACRWWDGGVLRQVPVCPTSKLP